jgi:hypothetical protein
MILLLTLLTLCSIQAPLFAGGKTAEDSDTPYYVNLRSDQGIYDGFVLDGNKYIPLTHISFSGQTALNDVVKETDSSRNRIDLSEVRSIRVLDTMYESQRYPEREWCLVAVTTFNGSVETMLMRPTTVICGISQGSEIKKSWTLRTINELEVAH